jgi:hypothetical protein
MNKVIYTILFVLITTALWGQDKDVITKEGIVTFKASENIYVRFSDTENISVGDTLYNNKSGILTPCLVVSKKSSSSCICIKLFDCSIEVKDAVIYQKWIVEKPATRDDLSNESGLTDGIDNPNEIVLDEDENSPGATYQQKISARASAATYSNLSNEENKDRHRTMMRFSINADHINNSKLSFESYINYRKNFIEGELPSDYKTSFINVYNLAVTYDIDSTMSISLGRKINRKISSIGPIDGLQVDKYFRNFFIGGVAGFKPDIFGFGFNSELYEYGAYFGHYQSNSSLYSMTTFGVLEQHNGGPVDRRYAYLQHSSTLWKSFNFFTSAEVDIYDSINGVSSNKPRLTNFYISTRYRANRALSFSLSYDARKRIIYYETLRTDVERLLADDDQRQGIRGRINFKPFKYINTSVSYSKRFQSNNQNKSDNVNVTLGHSKLPMLSGRLSFSFNMNESNYLSSKIMAFRYSRSIFKGKLQGDFYYRIVNYNYGNSDFNSSQNFYGTNLSIRLTKSLRLSILGELSTRSTDQRIRINTKLIKRFKSN